MTYQALYRTWRPQTFAQLIGQEHISRTLQNALSRGRMAHAYLFCGPRGTGKTSTAKILARAVNCENLTSGEPCGVCPSCLDVGSGRSVDVLEIDAASNRGIDEIRDLRDKVRYAPARLRVKVYIIDEVHMLTPEAFNALLKTLEEPPARVLFILATTEPHKLPATILSRCQRFDFYPLEVQAIVDHLADVVKKEGRKSRGEALLALARFADGGMRDALSLLEQALAFSEEELGEEDVLQVLGQAGLKHFLQVAKGVAASDAAACLNVLDGVVREGKDVNQFAKDLLAFFRDLTVAGMAPEEEGLLSGYSPERRKDIQEKGLLFSREALLEITEEVGRILNDMKWSEQPRLVLEVGFFRLCHLPPRLTLAQVMERMKALEEKLAGLEHVPHAATKEEGPAQSAKIVIKRENKGSIVKEAKKVGEAREKDTSLASASRQGHQMTENSRQEDEGEKGAPAVSKEEGERAWRDVLKMVKKDKPALYSYLGDSYVADTQGRMLVIAFRKNSEFCYSMLERRRADKAYAEYLLKKVLDSELSIKALKEPPAGGAGFVPTSKKRTSAPERKEKPYGNTPGEVAPPPEEAPRDTDASLEKDSRDDDLLVESARDIFNGNFIE